MFKEIFINGMNLKNILSSYFYFGTLKNFVFLKIIFYINIFDILAINLILNYKKIEMFSIEYN